MTEFSWIINNKASSTLARTGTLTTPHGIVETPGFIFCGTKAAINLVQ